MIVGCSPGGPGEPSIEQVAGDDASLYETGARWPRNYEGDGAWITVCYRTPGAVPGSTDEQDRIAFLERTKHAIRNTWGRVAHLYFDGWAPCGASTGGQMPSTSGSQCVDLSSGTADAGYPINMYTCHGGQNQEWDYYWP